MRTDPHATEVRTMVRRVFEHFLGEKAQSLNAATDHGSRYQGTQYQGTRFSGSRLKHRCGPPSTSVSSVAFSALPIDETLEIDETILIDQGRYVARSYRAGGWLAMWMVPVGIVQFYDSCGQMQGTINLFESLRPERIAA